MEDGELYAIAPRDIHEVLADWTDAVIVKNTEHPEGIFSAPIKVQIQATKACNLRCKTCAVFGGDCNRTPLMTNLQLFETLGKLANAGVLNVEWSGGEPLLRQGFWEFVRYTKDIGLSQNLLTNGTCFSPQNAEFLRTFYRIQISLDGVGEIFNNIVNRNAWDLFTKSLDYIQGANLNIVMATVLQRENVDHMDDVIGFCTSRGFSKIRVSLQVPMGRSLPISWKAYSEIIDRFRKKLPDLQKRAQDNGIELDTFLEKRLCEDETVEDVSRIVSPGGYSFLYVDSMGDLYPFPFLVQPSLRLGSIISEDLLKIWMHSKILDSIRQQTYLQTGCGRCRYECSFAERSLVLGFTGNIGGLALPNQECTERR
jgi:MoaA/NifB/PqqE/SkfB family radical SAM enzyme